VDHPGRHQGGLETCSESGISPGEQSVSSGKPSAALTQERPVCLDRDERPGEKSDPRLFEMFQKLGAARPSIAVGRIPAGIALSPDGSKAFVTNSGDNNVSVIEVNLSADPSFRALPTPVATGNWPGSIAVSPDGKYVFVANGESNSVTVFSGTPPFQPFALEVRAGNEWRLAVAQDGRVFVPKQTRDRDSAVISVIDTADAPPFKVLEDLKLADSTVEITGVATYTYSSGVFVFASDPNHYHTSGGCYGLSGRRAPTRLSP
jgi:DNA-binding beta-propeller fold protein YncE